VPRLDPSPGRSLKHRFSGSPVALFQDLFDLGPHLTATMIHLVNAERNSAGICENGSFMVWLTISINNTALPVITANLSIKSTIFHE
jgi:hypothetical protein